MSLWGEAFEIKQTPVETKKVIEKVKNPKQVTVTKRTKKAVNRPIVDVLADIYKEVYRILGVYKDNTVVIKSKEQLVKYIDKAIENKIIAIDTETNNSLDPITCKLMGSCIYTPGEKNAYIPVNHVNPQTKERLDWQVTEEDIKEQFDKLTENNVSVIVHNGKFDYQVLKCTTLYQMKMFWDTMIGAKMLDENELSYGLKQQYISKIDKSIEKYDIEGLFEGIEYAVVDPEIFALYAATDAYMTYKLYLLQKSQFEDPSLSKVYDVFINVEMPIVEVTAEMELAGVCIDKEYAKKLSNYYHAKAELVSAEISEAVKEYDELIAAWRHTKEAQERPLKKGKTALDDDAYGKSKAEQLEDPINLSSPTQLAIFFYDIVKVGVIDKKSPRGTGEAILEKIGLPICKSILKQRALNKIISTYIDKLPECVNEKTGRLHAKFNQLGAGTGRLSSSDPNLQNIPSHLKEIRLMFKAAEGSVFVGGDFSQQEVRILASCCNDTHMLDNYKNNRDIYATVASKVYNNKYEDNREFFPDGTLNPEGKKRRSFCKSIVLGKYICPYIR